MRPVHLAERARGRGLLARWALHRLLRAGARGDEYATDVVWRLWLDEPSDRLWSALSRWHRPAIGGGVSLVALGAQAENADVVAAARRAGHPVAAVARERILAGQQGLVDAVCAAVLSEQDDDLARFCVEHRLAPADAHRAAVFFLLTGQDEQYRLADPDHSLLATAYRGAGEWERTRIRERVAGEPEIVRVLADTVRRGRLARLSKREAEYLVDAFAGRQDWAGLWGLVKDLPVLDAAEAVRRFGDWRPGEGDRTLFDTLARAELVSLRESHRAVAEASWSEPRRLTFGTGTDPVFLGSFAQDGWLAVSTETWVSDTAGSWVYGFDPGFGQAAPRWGEHIRAVLALDGGEVVTGGGDRPASGFIWRGDGTKISTTGVVTALARTADGFAALTSDLLGLGLRLERQDGSRIFGLHDELGIPRGPHFRDAWSFAVDPASGRLAVAGKGLFLAELTETGPRPLASATVDLDIGPSAAFSAPDRLVVGSGSEVQVWRLADGELRRVARRTLRPVHRPVCPVVLTGAGAVAVIDAAYPQHEPNEGRVRFLDIDTLVDVPTPLVLEGLNPLCLFGSPDGTRLGIGGKGTVRISHGWCAQHVSDLADRPLAATTPADLHAVRAQLDRGETRPDALPFLELLHACLVHRFGTDVALGTAVHAGARTDDIALGGS